MFARIVTMNLKSGEATGFAQAIDDQVIPMLRKFNGFRDEIAMTSTDGKQAVGISFWQRREDAEAYHRAGFADVMKALSKHIEGTPTIKECEVTNSTAHDIKAKKGGA